ncbi:MAG: crossover junction endodeoxyribonuclease RuvC [bacterium]|nr:crossover junction endodeoxyribonuclease RuvC [bacterium]MCY3925418.1 crossover junction endodeoxyribonuclease RuvC [bacterium]
MFVLGIDPGLSRCGYSILSGRGASTRAVAAGVITTEPHEPVPQRLVALQQEIRRLLDEFAPSVLAIERVLFQINVRTAMGVGQAAGVVMAEAAATGCEVVEYSPNQVKQAVCGDGAATKQQVGEMVRMLLGLSEQLRPADVSDAAAVALCHMAQSPAPAVARR